MDDSNYVLHPLYDAGKAEFHRVASMVESRCYMCQRSVAKRIDGRRVKFVVAEKKSLGDVEFEDRVLLCRDCVLAYCGGDGGRD